MEYFCLLWKTKGAIPSENAPSFFTKWVDFGGSYWKGFARKAEVCTLVQAVISDAHTEMFYKCPIFKKHLCFLKEKPRTFKKITQISPGTWRTKKIYHHFLKIVSPPFPAVFTWASGRCNVQRNDATLTFSPARDEGASWTAWLSFS